MRDRLRLLLYHRLNIGDLVLASCALRALRALHPALTVGVVTNDFVEPIARRLPCVDQVWSYRKFASSKPRESALLARLRSFAPDRTFALSPSPDWRLAARVAFLRRGVGIGNGWLWRLAYRGAVLPDPDRDRLPHIANRLAAVMGIPPSRSLPDCALSREGTEPGRHDVLVHLDARKPSNRPEADQLIRVARALIQSDRSRRIVFTSTPDHDGHPAHQPNRGLAEQLRASLGAHPQCSFKTLVSVEDLILTLGSSRTVICPDGGAMHVAAAMGCKVVGLFGNVDPLVWGPRSALAIALQSPTRRVADIAPDSIVRAAVQEPVGVFSALERTGPFSEETAQL